MGGPVGESWSISWIVPGPPPHKLFASIECVGELEGGRLVFHETRESFRRRTNRVCRGGLSD